MTTKDKHLKHPPLSRPSIGNYHRVEWAIYGTNCGEIAQLYDRITSANPNQKFLYVDADHNPENAQNSRFSGTKKMVSSHDQTWNHFDDRLNTFAVDAAIVNGNHYPATKQIVIINPEKKDSLLRRIDQLTEIAVVITDDSAAIYDFVKDRMSGDTLILATDDISGLARYIQSQIVNAVPKLKAVVLAGGKSQRMGTDKSQIEYHNGVTQEEWLLTILKNKGINTYLSKSYTYSDKAKNIDVIKDRFVDLGPCGAIMSAMMTDPDAAWLVLAVDLPLITDDAIDYLISQRDPSKYATAYKVSENAFPEPLVAIYEPRSYQRFLQFLSLGYACPRKVLINNDTHTVLPTDTDVLTNVNTPEEKDTISKLLP